MIRMGGVYRTKKL